MSDAASLSGRVRIGISSWGSLPGFYPPRIKSGDKLAWYGRSFDLVEVNVSFYRVVPPHTYVQWIDTTPDGFQFDVKAFQELTHFSDPPPDETFDAFRRSYEPLREFDRLGCVLFQFPPRFTNSPASRAHLERVATEMAGDLCTVEFRNYTWLTPENAEGTFQLLRQLGLVYAVADEPQFPQDTVPPLVAVTNPHLAYLRLHGRNADTWYRDNGQWRYDYDYPEPELEAWKRTVMGLVEQVERVHVLFNNNARGAGTKNALALAEMLGIKRDVEPVEVVTQPRLM